MPIHPSGGRCQINKASTQYKVSIVYSVACSALECSVTVLPDMRTIIAGAAERGRVKEGFKLDCGVVLVIALSLRTASCHFEQFAQTVEADSQPCLNEGLAKKKKKKSGMTTPWWTGRRAVRATICAELARTKISIDSTCLFVCHTHVVLVI